MALAAIIILIVCVLIVGLLLKRLLWVPSLPALDGKHVLITGGSSGIGKAAAIQAAKLGADVTIIARNLDRLNTAKEEILKAAKRPGDQKITCLSLDVTQNYDVIKTSLTKLENDVSPVYMLVNCAGMAVCGKLEDLKEDDFRLMMDLNYYGTVFPTKVIAESMKKRREGHIVITGSQASLLGLFGYSAYCSSKFALRGLAEALHMELTPHNVSVTLCLPPDTNTPGFENEEKSKPIETKLISQTAGLMEPTDVANQLLSDALNRKFVTTVGFEGFILTTLCTGMGPIGSFADVFLEVSLMSILRLVSVGYLINFQRIIRGCNQQTEMSKKTE